MAIIGHFSCYFWMGLEVYLNWGTLRHPPLIWLFISYILTTVWWDRIARHNYFLKIGDNPAHSKWQRSLLSTIKQLALLNLSEIEINKKVSTFKILSHAYNQQQEVHVYLSISVPVSDRTSLQTDLDEWLDYYNNQRTHQGKICCGRTPIAILIDGKSVRKKISRLNLTWRTLLRNH